MCVIFEKEGDDALLVPPTNFSAVEDNCIYRSGFPQLSNFPFLQSLNLRSIIYLCPEPYPEENLGFLRINNINLFQFGIDGTKEPSAMSSSAITEALKVIIDVRNHPVLIHCKRGKHRFHKWINMDVKSVRNYISNPTCLRFRYKTPSSSDETLCLRSIISGDLTPVRKHKHTRPLRRNASRFRRISSDQSFRSNSGDSGVNFPASNRFQKSGNHLQPRFYRSSHFLYFLHRTGCLVGCLRILQNWCMSAVVEEYKHFAGTKWRETDLKFLKNYDVSRIRHCLESIIYRYYGSKKRRLQYREESLQKPQMTSVL